ncbi:hypothetical protein ACQEU3_16915 [Spirillospora sp. CA-253888]
MRSPSTDTTATTVPRTLSQLLAEDAGQEVDGARRRRPRKVRTLRRGT